MTGLCSSNLGMEFQQLTPEMAKKEGLQERAVVAFFSMWKIQWDAFDRFFPDEKEVNKCFGIAKCLNALFGGPKNKILTAEDIPADDYPGTKLDPNGKRRPGHAIVL